MRVVRSFGAAPKGPLVMAMETTRQGTYAHTHIYINQIYTCLTLHVSIRTSLSNWLVSRLPQTVGSQGGGTWPG